MFFLFFQSIPQEAEFGVNMYDTITPADEPEISHLTSLGYTTEDAVLLIFQRSHRSRNPSSYIPVPAVANHVSPYVICLRELVLIVDSFVLLFLS